MDEPLILKKYQLERFPGKGGWTYIRIPEIPQDRNSAFGLKRVKGRIDHVEFNHNHLMPMGNGQLFLPVKAAIRKTLKKEAGDWVEVLLLADNDPLEIPEEFINCLQDEPAAWHNFQMLSEGAKNEYVRHIYAAKREETKVERIAEAIRRIAGGNIS